MSENIIMDNANISLAGEALIAWLVYRDNILVIDREVREKIRMKFQKIFENHCEIIDAEEISYEIELSMFEKYQKLDRIVYSQKDETIYNNIIFKNRKQKKKRAKIDKRILLYKNCYRDLLFNLTDKSNPELISKILKNKITTYDLVDMDNKELASDKLKKIRKYESKWNILDANCDIKPTSICSMYRCGRCKKWETTYYQLQTRSSDEPMTTFVSCCTPGCNKRWRC